MWSAHLVEPRIYKFVEGAKFVDHAGTPATPQLCVEENFVHGAHQGTPMLSLTLCKRGECEPSVHNTLLMGIGQHRVNNPDVNYDKRVVTWNATSPYEFHSISKPVVFAGTADWNFTWAGGMVYYWNQTGIPANRSHGFLDDEVWLSFGVADRESGWIDVKAGDLMNDHISC